MIFNRLAIGTANWGKEYNGVKVSEDDQKRILDYCREVGIDMIDTATAYEWDWTKVSDFKVVSKGRPEDCKKEFYAFLSHGDGWIWQAFYDLTSYKNDRIGLSIYEPVSIPKFGTFGTSWGKIIQVPYSLYDRRFEPYFPKLKEQGIEIHVRSIFLRGRILEEFSPHDCIAFCLMNPYIDRVILGADSYDQFIYNLARFDTMCSSQVNDENIIDPRKWKEEK